MLKLDNPEELKKEFKKLFKDAYDITVKTSYNGYLSVKVELNFSTGLTFDTLINIAEIFGTDKYDIVMDSETHTYAISEVTIDSETTYEYNFYVNLDDVNTGVRWRKNDS